MSQSSYLWTLNSRPGSKPFSTLRATCTLSEMSVMKAPTATVSPRDILRKYKTIAVVGASKNPQKDAYTVPQFMKDHGYSIVPINPTADEIVGEKAYPSLVDLPPEIAGKVEIVDVFRPSEELPQVAQQVVDRKSTRLNSSHLVISYAVFCLKKKKHQPHVYRLNS